MNEEIRPPRLAVQDDEIILNRPDDLREVAKKLREAIQAIRSQPDDVLAYQLLRKDGEVWPHGDEAEAKWRSAKGNDPWRNHHLAVLLHCRAYDLEEGESNEATRFWHEALENWSAVHQDESFWACLANSVSRATGAQVTVDDLRPVRETIPHDLLSVHLTLARRYRETNPARTRTHLDILKHAPFDEKTRAKLRDEFHGEALRAATEAADGADFAEATHRLWRQLEVDDDYLPALRLLLQVLRRWNEHAERTRDSKVLLNNTLASKRIVEILDSIPGAIDAPFIREEVARHHFWVGAGGVIAAEDAWAQHQQIPDGVLVKVQQLGASSVAAMKRAVKTDPLLTTDAYYSALPLFEGQCHYMAGLAHFVAGTRGKPDELRAAVIHFREAIKLRPSQSWQHIYLAQCLLQLDPVKNRAEFNKTLERAQELAALTEDPEDDIAVENLKRQAEGQAASQGLNASLDQAQEMMNRRDWNGALGKLTNADVKYLHPLDAAIVQFYRFQCYQGLWNTSAARARLAASKNFLIEAEKTKTSLTPEALRLLQQLRDAIAGAEASLRG